MILNILAEVLTLSHSVTKESVNDFMIIVIYIENRSLCVDHQPTISEIGNCSTAAKVLSKRYCVMNLPAICILLASAIIWNTGKAFAEPISESFPDEGSSSNPQGQQNWHTIEGKVNPPEKKATTEWLSTAQILINGGEHVGFLKEDGTFVINGLSAGSYIVDVIHPQMNYDSARIDITSKGKLRARKVNHIQPALVTHVQYPLRLSPMGPYRYFQPREQWRITDVLMSPMVLMMILPLILIVILPKMMSDPETRREMEQVSLPKYEMPEMSEMLTNLFGGGKESGEPERKGQKSIKSKKNN